MCHVGSVLIWHTWSRMLHWPKLWAALQNKSAMKILHGKSSLYTIPPVAEKNTSFMHRTCLGLQVAL